MGTLFLYLYPSVNYLHSSFICFTLTCIRLELPEIILTFFLNLSSSLLSSFSFYSSKSTNLLTLGYRFFLYSRHLEISSLESNIGSFRNLGGGGLDNEGLYIGGLI